MVEGSDAAAIAKLGEMFTAAGGKWEQTSIAGHTANTLAKLRADVVAGNAPPAVQLKGPEIAEWNATGMTANLDDLANEGRLGQGRRARTAAGDEADRQLGRGADEHPSHQLDLGLDQGHGAGRNQGVAEDLGRVQRRLRQGGRRPSHLPRPFQRGLDRCDDLRGRRLRQDHDLFKKAFVEGDTAAMRSDGMVKAFEQFRTMVSKYMDPAIAGRDYQTATDMIAKNQAVFMIMGDWQIGIFTAAGFKSGEDYVCAQAPTDWGKPGFILNSDSVVFFKQKDPDYVAGQKLLAHLILSPQFQTVFNQAKGSIPARLDVDLSKGFNPCQQMSQKDLQASIAGGTLVRSMAHNMTILQKYRGAIMEVITSFVNTPAMSAKDAANAMADAVEAQK